MESDPVARVRRYLAQHQAQVEIREFDESTKTAEDAARTVGVEVRQIAKSLLFLIGDEPVMVVASGDLKVSQSKLKQHLGVKGKVKLPDPSTTIELTGFPPGGVCPFALPVCMRVLIDVSMKRYPVVYIAAGTTRSAAPVTVEQLLAITGGEECDLCSEPVPVAR